MTLFLKFVTCFWELSPEFIEIVTSICWNCQLSIGSFAVFLYVLTRDFGTRDELTVSRLAVPRLESFSKIARLIT